MRLVTVSLFSQALEVVDAEQGTVKPRETLITCDF